MDLKFNKGLKVNFETLFALFYFFTILMSCSSNTTENFSQTEKAFYSLRQEKDMQTPKLFEVSIENKSNIELDMDHNSRRIEQSANADITMSIQYDSANNSIITTTYRNIKFSKKNGTEEFSYDAADGVNNFDPTTRILGMLKNAKITTIISPRGELLTVNGLKELGDSVMATVNTPDINSRQQLRQQWDNMIQEGIVNKNTQQLFGIIPDSAVRVGDSWTRQHKEQGEIGLATSVTYSLEKVVESIAYISALGIITADNNVCNMLQPSANADLHGKMKGNYEVDMTSGLVLKSNVETSAAGVMVVMGKSIPIEIKNTSRVEGKIIREK